MIAASHEKFLELLLLNSKDGENFKEKMQEFLVNFGKDPKPYCPIQFEMRST